MTVHPAAAEARQSCVLLDEGLARKIAAANAIAQESVTQIQRPTRSMAPGVMTFESGSNVVHCVSPLSSGSVPPRCTRGPKSQRCRALTGGFTFANDSDEGLRVSEDAMCSRQLLGEGRHTGLFQFFFTGFLTASPLNVLSTSGGASTCGT
jgi:hypothetical protein